MKKLEFLIDNIATHTGINVSVFSEDMKYVNTSKTPIMPNKTDFSNIYLSKEQSKTFFRFTFYGVNYIGYIDGAEEYSKNYAYLIISFIENYYEEKGEITYGEMVGMIAKGVATTHQIESFVSNYSIKNGNCFVMAITKDRLKIGEIANYLLKNKKTNSDLIATVDDTTIAYIKIVDGYSEKPQTDKFAYSVYNDIYRATGEKVIIGVGSYKANIYKASVSFKEAVMSNKMNGFLYNNSAIHNYSHFMLIRLLEDQPKYRLKEITSTLLDEEGKKLLEDEDMLLTAEVLMENNLNISEASRDLYMHRNTLTYRLDKIQKATNLNIRQFSDAVTFRILSIIKKITD